MKAGLIGLIKLYQLVISPALPGTCRFEPTCSRYAIESIRRHGAARGLALTALRLLKCQPLHPGGHDPVQ